MKVGDLYPVWWWTGVREGNWNMALVLAVKPYTGRYTEFFNATLTLMAPSTKRGTTEMAVKL